MRQLVESLVAAGFHEVNQKTGKPVAKEQTSSEWAHVRAKEPDKDGKISTTFVKDKKKVEFEHQTSGATSLQWIRFYDGDRLHSYTNSGDIPSEAFLKAFYESEEKK
jgi:hypothetical protein